MARNKVYLPNHGMYMVATAIRKGWLEPEEAEEIKMFALEKRLGG